MVDEKLVNGEVHVELCHHAGVVNIEVSAFFSRFLFKGLFSSYKPCFQAGIVNVASWQKILMLPQCSNTEKLK